MPSDIGSNRAAWLVAGFLGRKVMKVWEWDAKIAIAYDARSLSCRPFSQLKRVRRVPQQDRTTRKVCVDHTSYSRQMFNRKQGTIAWRFKRLLHEVCFLFWREAALNAFCFCREKNKNCCVRLCTHYDWLYLLHLSVLQDMLGRWSLIPVLAVGLCLWTKWRTQHGESKLEKDKLDKVSCRPVLPGWT